MRHLELLNKDVQQLHTYTLTAVDCDVDVGAGGSGCTTNCGCDTYICVVDTHCEKCDIGVNIGCSNCYSYNVL